ncbi:MAG TPA: hypothetical protein VLD63_02755 [Anaerolineales bacterium]|nr:hypothetical protein [Anaerolineales bacterium]
MAALGQGVRLTNDYVLPWTKAAWRTRNMSAMDRSARFLLGNKGSAYLRFLEDRTPLDASVVVPEGVGAINEQSVLQFLLMPRGIPVCGCSQTPYSESCLVCLRDPKAYVPAVGRFPEAAALEGYKHFLPFPGQSDWYRGLWVPEGTQLSESPPSGGASVPVGVAVAADVLTLLALTFLGFVIVRLLDAQADWIESVILGLPLGTGTVTWIVFLLGWAGARITIGVFVAAYLGILAAGLWLTRRFHKALRLLPAREEIQLVHPGSLRASPLAVGSWLVIIGLFSASILISVARGYSHFDAIANWALKGYAIAQQGTVFAGALWGGHGLSYPQNLHLAIALFRLLDGDVLPGSKLLFPLFTGCMLLVCFRFWRRRGLDGGWAAVGVLALFTVPVLYAHGTYGWGNIIAATYVVIGSLLSVEGILEGSTSRLPLAGLFLAFAAWTRPEGVLYAWGVVAALLLARRLVRAPHRLPKAWLAALVVVPGSYLAFSGPSLAGDEIGGVIRAFSGEALRGGLSIQPLLDLVRFSMTRFGLVSTWGYLYPLAGLLFVVGSLYRGRVLTPGIRGSLVSAGMAIAIPLGMFFAAAYSKEDLGRFLYFSFDRALLAGSALLLVWALLRASPNVKPTR